MNLTNLREWLEELNLELEEADTEAYKSQVREIIKIVLDKIQKEKLCLTN